MVMLLEIYIGKSKGSLIQAIIRNVFDERTNENLRTQNVHDRQTLAQAACRIDGIAVDKENVQNGGKHDGVHKDVRQPQKIYPWKTVKHFMQGYSSHRILNLTNVMEYVVVGIDGAPK